ncbi:MAG: hypothetical protein K6E38_05600 [Fretibacterium sp.]|nr:hypothetical protein [Fretibacterium sp.]
MKKALTRDLLKKNHAKKHKSGRSLFLFTAFYCLLCAALISVRLIGVPIAAAVMVGAFVMYTLYTRLRHIRSVWNINRPYFSPLSCCVAEKYGVPTRRLTRRTGFVSLILGAIVAAVFYYGAVCLLVEGIQAMPPTPLPTAVDDK